MELDKEIIVDVSINTFGENITSPEVSKLVFPSVPTSISPSPILLPDKIVKEVQDDNVVPKSSTKSTPKPPVLTKKRKIDDVENKPKVIRPKRKRSRRISKPSPAMDSCTIGKQQLEALELANKMRDSIPDFIFGIEPIVNTDVRVVLIKNCNVDVDLLIKDNDFSAVEIDDICYVNGWLVLPIMKVVTDEDAMAFRNYCNTTFKDLYVHDANVVSNEVLSGKRKFVMKNSNVNPVDLVKHYPFIKKYKITLSKKTLLYFWSLEDLRRFQVRNAGWEEEINYDDIYPYKLYFFGLIFNPTTAYLDKYFFPALKNAGIKFNRIDFFRESNGCRRKIGNGHIWFSNIEYARRAFYLNPGLPVSGSGFVKFTKVKDKKDKK